MITTTNTLVIRHYTVDSLHQFCLPPGTLSSGNCQLFNCSLYLWVHFVLLCLLICFCFLPSSYEWNNIVFVFLHLIYFIQHNSVKVHQCCKCQNFILFYGWLVFIVFIYKNIFLVHLFIDRHLGSFHILTIANKTAKNTGVPVSFWGISWWLRW